MGSAAWHPFFGTVSALSWIRREQVTRSRGKVGAEDTDQDLELMFAVQTTAAGRPCTAFLTQNFSELGRWTSDLWKSVPVCKI
jgi:hypothetical protein